MSAAPPLHRINVLEVHPGKHCFYGISRPKVLFVPADFRGDPYHEIAVLPVSLDLEGLARLDDVPSLAWEPAQTARGKVVFDASLEGHPHEAPRTRALHAALDRIRVPREQAVYVTQDRGYAERYHAWCKASGDGPPMKVVVFDYWVRQVAQQHHGVGAEVFEARLDAYFRRPRRRTHRFLCLNRTLRQTKALFLLQLIRDGLWERGAISLARIGWWHGQNTPWRMEKRLRRTEGFAELAAELAPFLPKLYQAEEVIFETGQRDRPSGLIMDEPLSQYGESWFSVITETEMASWPCRITEKPLKALMNFHPLLVLGNPGSLGFLRGYGFETFPMLFDESYDDELEPARRFERVVSEVRRLCAVDESVLDRLDREAEAAVIANARHGLVELPELFHSHLNRALVEAVLAPSGESV